MHSRIPRQGSNTKLCAQKPARGFSLVLLVLEFPSLIVRIKFVVYWDLYWGSPYSRKPPQGMGSGPVEGCIAHLGLGFRGSFHT